MANQFNLKVYHMDVKTAFLNGILKEEIFMKILEGLPYEDGKVCKLNKSIYGLKQAARCWFEKFENILIFLDVDALWSVQTIGPYDTKQCLLRAEP